MQLFCFTYAGGNASFYGQLEKELESKVNVIALEYSGHGSRHKEPFYRNFDELAEDMYLELKKKIVVGEPYALLGYSMGSISAVEVLRRIVNNKYIQQPCHVFLAAHEPYLKVELKGFDENELNSVIKERTLKFGGIPKKLVNNNSFWRIYLPIYKADYTIIGKYDFERLDIKSVIPATIFYSESDIPFQAMEKWRNYFIGETDFIRYAGSHFFIRQYYQDMGRIIIDKLVFDMLADGRIV